MVTVLSETGAPTPVAWTRLRAPRSLMAAIGPEAVTEAAKASPLYAKYGETVDRESAYETLTSKINTAPQAGQQAPPPGAPADVPPAAPAEAPAEEGGAEEGGGFFAKAGSFFGSPLGRQITSTVTREVTRSLFGTRRRR